MVGGSVVSPRSFVTSSVIAIRYAVSDTSACCQRCLDKLLAAELVTCNFIRKD